MTHRELLDDVLEQIGPAPFLDPETDQALEFYAAVHFGVLDADNLPAGCTDLAEKWEHEGTQIETDGVLGLFHDLAETMELYWQAVSNEVEDATRLERARWHLLTAACLVAAAIVAS